MRLQNVHADKRAVSLPFFIGSIGQCVLLVAVFLSVSGRSSAATPADGEILASAATNG